VPCAYIHVYMYIHISLQAVPCAYIHVYMYIYIYPYRLCPVPTLTPLDGAALCLDGERCSTRSHVRNVAGSSLNSWLKLQYTNPSGGSPACAPHRLSWLRSLRYRAGWDIKPLPPAAAAAQHAMRHAYDTP
jgi:hypothetical protein